MGRGKVQMKKIEDKNSRQATFSKRRTGLMKKATELSVLCDVEVALFILTAKGRFYEFSSGDNLRTILERYLMNLGKGDNAHNHAREVEKHHSEDTGLWSEIDRMHITLSNLQENVDQLNVVELTQLEQKLDAILRQTRSKKVQLMMEAVTTLHDEVGPIMNEDGNQPIPQQQNQLVSMEIIPPQDGESSVASPQLATFGMP